MENGEYWLRVLVDQFLNCRLFGCDCLGIYGGILSVQGCEYLGDGLCEDTGVWMDHAREVFLFYCLFDLALQCGFNEIDIIELSDALVIDITDVGNLWCC